MNISSKPRVTMIMSHLTPLFGMEKVALTVLQLLRKKYDVKVVCVGGDDSDLRQFPGAVLLGRPLRGLNRLRSLPRLSKLARRLDTDVVITVGVWVSVPWLLVAGRSASRTIVWEHSMMGSRVRHSRQLKVLAKAARFLYKRSNRVVTVSRPLEVDIASMCTGVSVITIPNPVEMAVVPSDIPGRKRTSSVETQLLTVGSLSSVKAQDRVIRALSFLDDTYTLTIVGSGPERARLESLADQLQVGHRVSFEGYLPAGDVEKRMLNSDLLIHSAVVETFGLVYVEAANAGLRVVSTRNPVAEEMIPAYVPGWISDPDPESLARLIELHRLTEVGQNQAAEAESRRRAEFASDSVLAKWESVIESMSVPEGDRRQ